MLALKEGGRLVSRRDPNHTRRFPHLAEALAALKPARLTLDGEVAARAARTVCSSNATITSTRCRTNSRAVVPAGGYRYVSGELLPRPAGRPAVPGS